MFCFNRERAEKEKAERERAERERLERERERERDRQERERIMEKERQEWENKQNQERILNMNETMNEAQAAVEQHFAESLRHMVSAFVLYFSQHLYKTGYQFMNNSL